ALMAALNFVDVKNMLALACRTLHRSGSLPHPERRCIRAGSRPAIAAVCGRCRSNHPHLCATVTPGQACVWCPISRQPSSIPCRAYEIRLAMLGPIMTSVAIVVWHDVCSEDFGVLL